MAEEIRVIRVAFEVVTNKKTLTSVRELDHIDEVDDVIAEMKREVRI